MRSLFAQSPLARARRTQAGQGLTEYIVVVALVAVAAIGVVSVFGKDIRELFAAATGSMAGETSTSNKAKRANVKEKGLSNFGNTTKSGD